MWNVDADDGSSAARRSSSSVAVTKDFVKGDQKSARDEQPEQSLLRSLFSSQSSVLSGRLGEKTELLSFPPLWQLSDFLLVRRAGSGSRVGSQNRRELIANIFFFFFKGGVDMTEEIDWPHESLSAAHS